MKKRLRNKGEIDIKLIELRCMFTYAKFKIDLLECTQCKLIGNKEGEKQDRCYVCWGELITLE